MFNNKAGHLRTANRSCIQILECVDIGSTSNPLYYQSQRRCQCPSYRSDQNQLRNGFGAVELESASRSLKALGDEDQIQATRAGEVRHRRDRHSKQALLWVGQAVTRCRRWSFQNWFRQLTWPEYPKPPHIFCLIFPPPHRFWKATFLPKPS